MSYVNAIIITLSSVTWGEQVRRADALADLIETGRVAAVYDDDRFLGILDMAEKKVTLPLLATALA
jgi:hypothetical protein